jgi:hypothetical protein
MLRDSHLVLSFNKHQKNILSLELPRLFIILKRRSGRELLEAGL